MNTETTEQVVDEEEQAFLREMEDADDALPPADEKGSESLTETEKGSESLTEEAETERLEVIPGFTEAEIREQFSTIAKLKKSIDTTNGTYGSRMADMQKRIDQLTAKPLPATDAPKPASISADRFKRLKGEFPELAELLSEDLGEILQPGASADVEGIKSEVSQQLADDRAERLTKEAAREMRLLSREHPDWREVAAYSPAENGIVQWHNQAFGAWVATQPEETQTAVLHGRDAFDLADIISDYKATLTAQPVVKKQTGTNLSKAIQPRGAVTARAPALDEEERLFREELSREEL